VTIDGKILLDKARGLPEFLQSLTWQQVWDYRTAFLSRPLPTWPFMEGYVAFLVILFLAGIVVLLRRRLYAPYRSVLLQFFWTNLFLATLLFFFRWQRIPIFGMDFLRTAHFLFMLGWVALILKYRLTAYRRDRLMILVEERRQKYLPRPKTAQ
jgi:hypothetical protein